MRADEVARRITTPLTGPAFPPTRPRFTDREYLNVVYRTDPAAARAAVPEPLGIGEPLVRFEVMRMGDVSGYGPYVEAGQAIEVVFDGERGEYLHAMYLDNLPAITSGRELSAYPKTVGQPALTVDHGALVGVLNVGAERVATATVGYKHRELAPELARQQIAVPTFMVKTVRGYDGSPTVTDLVRTEITDIVVRQAWTGPARLQLFHHVMAPLADLPVLEVVSASHIVTDLTLAPVRPVHDYLNGARS